MQKFWGYVLKSSCVNHGRNSFIMLDSGANAFQRMNLIFNGISFSLMKKECFLTNEINYCLINYRFSTSVGSNPVCGFRVWDFRRVRGSVLVDEPGFRRV